VIIPLLALLAAHPPAPPSPADDLHDLPLVTLPAPASQTSPYFAIVLSGDGGWAALDKQVAGELVSSGVPVVGLNSQRYFWTLKTPDRIGADLGRIIRHYEAAWGLHQVVLVGYSRGADVLPLMVNRMPKDLHDHVRLIGLLGLAHGTDLLFRPTDILISPADPRYQLGPEMERLKGLPIVCVYGSHEKDTLCPDLPEGLVDPVELEGGHHFDGDYRGLGRLIFEKAR
jgi:type IV secretory pathway VirJ component